MALDLESGLGSEYPSASGPEFLSVLDSAYPLGLVSESLSAPDSVSL